MKVRIAILTLVSLIAVPATGQISTETPPTGRTLPAAESVEQEMATARFRLGPLRLLPFLSLGNVGWTNNALLTSEGAIDDYTASISAGTKLVAPFGRKVFLRGTVAPSYDWYYRSVQLRSFGGTYSGEALGLFNRLTLDGGGSYDRRIRSVSSEVARDVLSTTSRGFAKVELEALKRLSVFGGAEQATLKQEDNSPATPGLQPVSALNRTETAFRAGVRYGFSPTLSLGVMGEVVRTRFVTNPSQQDNDVRGILFVARYDGERFYLEGTAGVREGKAVTANDYYPEFRTGSYGYFASYFVARSIEVQIVGSRRPAASLFLDNPYYLETRNGVVLRLAAGRRISFHVDGELASNRYVNPVLVVSTGEIVTRVDDTTRYGAGFDVTISRAVKVGLSATRDRYDSNIDYYDRSVFRLMGGLTVTADFAREGRR